MIGSTRQVSVYAHATPVDMRRSFDGLFALVEQGLGRDPLSGELFLFVSRNRLRAKVLLLLDPLREWAYRAQRLTSLFLLEPYHEACLPTHQTHRSG